MQESLGTEYKLELRRSERTVFIAGSFSKRYILGQDKLLWAGKISSRYIRISTLTYKTINLHWTSQVSGCVHRLHSNIAFVQCCLPGNTTIPFRKTSSLWILANWVQVRRQRVTDLSYLLQFKNYHIQALSRPWICVGNAILQRYR
jgi:hypothetical protein